MKDVIALILFCLAIFLWPEESARTFFGTVLIAIAVSVVFHD